MRVLFFVHSGTNSRDILLDMGRGFERAGHEVLRWELEPMMRVHQAGAAARGAVAQAMSGMVAEFLRSNRVDLSVGMWANALGLLAHGVREGSPASFFDLVESPHLMFWLDAPHWAAGGGMQELFGSPLLRGGHVRHYVNNPGIAREMTDVLGFGPTIGRRYGIDEEVFRPHGDVAVAYDVVFGTGPGDGKPSEVMLRELEREEPDVEAIRRERAERVQPKLDDHAKSFGGAASMMTEFFRRLLERRLARAGVPLLEEMAEVEAAGHELAGRVLRANPRAFVRAGALLRSIDAWRRAFTITFLSKRMKCAVFGGAALEHWPCEAKMLGNLKYQDMARAYSAGRIGLNAMRWQDDIGLNIKPYEVTASGACLLCDRRVGFGEVFEEGVEAEGFATPGEALVKARELLADEQRRCAMAEAGRARTLRDHTWAAAADELIAFGMGRHVSERAAA